MQNSLFETENNQTPQNPGVPLDAIVMPSILDACCGGKIFWFDKENEDVLFTDIRSEEFTTGEGRDKRNRRVLPDKIEDFRDMSHKDETLKMVVFDPPHLFVGGKQLYGAYLWTARQSDMESGFDKGFLRML